MILKERTKSVSHLILESLNSRKTLSSVEKAQYDNQVKGFAGEQQFDRAMKAADLPGLVLNDVLLSTRDTYYQIDSLVVTDDHIHLYEVKNYTGAYTYRDGMLHADSGHVLQDPVAQAERKRSYLHNLLLNHGYHLEISVHVVFINPDFYIYSLPKRPDILFAGQLSGHFSQLSQTLPKQKDKALPLAKKLIALQNVTYRPTNLPDYTRDQLKTGILCPKCFSFEYERSRQMRTCSSCRYREKASEALQRSINEFALLFPTVPLTKQAAYDWCGKDWSTSRIKRVLTSNYQVKSAGRGSYYS